MDLVSIFLGSALVIALFCLFVAIWVSSGREFKLREENARLFQENAKLQHDSSHAWRVASGMYFRNQSIADSPADLRIAAKDDSYLRRLSQRRKPQPLSLPLDQQETMQRQAFKLSR